MAGWTPSSELDAAAAAAVRLVASDSAVGLVTGLLLLLPLAAARDGVKGAERTISLAHKADEAEEEAAATLGATRFATFRRVVFPAIRSAVMAGTLLTFSRCLGEIGSVILVSGNRTGHTLTAPVFIFSLTSQFRFAEAAAVATFLFAISFVLVLATGRLVKQRAVSE